MSTTPRTDRETEDARNVALEFETRLHPKPDDGPPLVVLADFSRQLERELEEAKEAGALLQRHVNLARKVANCPDDETLVVVIEELQSRLTSAKSALEKAREALETCRMVVQNEINVREMLGKPTQVWPDLLTGCVSGGGIEDAITTINAVLEATR